MTQDDGTNDATRRRKKTPHELELEAKMSLVHLYAWPAYMAAPRHHLLEVGATGTLEDHLVRTPLCLGHQNGIRLYGSTPICSLVRIYHNLENPSFLGNQILDLLLSGIWNFYKIREEGVELCVAHITRGERRAVAVIKF